MAKSETYRMAMAVKSRYALRTLADSCNVYGEVLMYGRRSITYAVVMQHIIYLFLARR